MIARIKTIYCDGCFKLICGYQAFTIIGRINKGPAITLAVAMTNSTAEAAYDKIVDCVFRGVPSPIACMTDMEFPMRNGINL